jgi:ParB-like chromosome segregation protein Spo0J
MPSPYQLLPPLTDAEYTALKANIAANGVLVAIEFDEAGNTLDGHHRLQICEELSITDYAVTIRYGLTELEKRAHVRSLNVSRRHLTGEQRRALIADQLTETPERSDRSIAAALNVNHETVGAVRETLVSTGEIRQLERTVIFISLWMSR